VDTRLTLYAYIEKIAGPGTVRIYSLVNGVLFCVLAGAMITVSASAVRILFDLPPQVNWYPTSLGFVAVAMAVGLVVVAISIKGFRRVAQFAEVCAPWMVLMFAAGALTLLPLLTAATPGVDGIHSFSDFKRVADTFIWKESNPDLSLWHVAAFAWVCNLAMHGGLSDMTILRFAKKYQYGYFSAFGMFVGHFLAWVFAGIMGAGASEIEVNCSIHEGARKSVSVAIRDDGCGIRDAPAQSGRGIRNMEARAAALGAAFKLESCESGTQVSVRMSPAE
jgi:NCS1 family nucleobase:cation symporter-1